MKRYLLNFIKVLKKNKEYLIFTCARVSGLVVKPSILFMLIAFDVHTESVLYSKYLLCLISVYSIFKAPLHFDFYKKYFNSGKKAFPKISATLYKLNTLSVLIALTPISLIFVNLLIDNIVLSLFVVLSLFSEKLFDEVQRFQQYSKSFIEWSALFLTKNFLPLVFAVIYLYTEANNFFLSFLLMSSFTNVVASIYLSSFSLKLNAKYLNRSVKNIPKILNILLKNHGLKFLILILYATYTQLDRMVLTLFFNSQMLADITFMSQFANGIVILSSFVFIHPRKASFIHRLKFKDLIPFRKISLVLIATFTFTYLSFIFVSNFAQTTSFSLSFSILYFLSFTVLAVDLIMNEYQFWNQNPLILIAIEFIVILLFIVLSLLVGIDFLAIIFFITTLIRLILHSYLEFRAVK